MKTGAFIVLLLMIFGCSSGFGNKLKSEQLDVYYDNDELASLADSLGSFWTKNELIGDRKQSIKIKKSANTYQVCIIQSEEFQSEKLDPMEIALLQELRADLQEKVFEKKTTSIVICNDEFESLIVIKE